MCTIYGVLSHFTIFCCTIIFFAIYAVLSRNQFWYDLRAFAWRKIVPLEKEWQIWGMKGRCSATPALWWLWRFWKKSWSFPHICSVHLRRFCSHISGTKNLPKARNSAFLLADQPIGLEVDNQCWELVDEKTFLQKSIWSPAHSEVFTRFFDTDSDTVFMVVVVVGGMVGPLRLQQVLIKPRKTAGVQREGGREGCWA